MAWQETGGGTQQHNQIGGADRDKYVLCTVQPTSVLYIITYVLSPGTKDSGSGSMAIDCHWLASD